MKRYKKNRNLSQCRFDFDLGPNYDAARIEDAIFDIFTNLDYEVQGVDFEAVKYPRNRMYSQCLVNFTWVDSYNENAIEEAVADFIDDEGGNFFGMDFEALD